jgi:hypothetical protein
MRLDLETLDLVLEGADLAHEVGGLVRGDAAGNDGASDTAGAAESHLRGDVDVGDVLVLAEEGKVEQDGEGAGVSGEDDDLADTAVEGLGGLVGALLELAVVSSLLDEIEDLLGQSLISLWPRGATMEVSHGRNRDTVGAHESSFQRGSNIRGISHFRFVCWRVLVVVRVHCLARR